MSYILGEEVKPSLSELRHYGTKGMKWGVRRSDAQLARSRGSASKGPSRKENRKKRNEAIKRARVQQKKDIKKAAQDEVALYKSLVKGGRKEAYAQLQKSSDKAYRSENARMAAKKTSGEKAVNALLFGAGAAVVGYQAVGQVAINKILANSNQTEPANQLGSLKRAKKKRGVYNVTSM